MPKNTQTKMVTGTEGNGVLTDNRDKLGRRTKCTPEVTERICKLIAEGNYIGVSAEASGISRRSFFDWIKRGEHNIEAGIESNYADFLLSVQRAEAEAEANLVKLVKNAAPKNWVAAMTLLERRHPERWGRKDRSTIQLGHRVQFEVRLVERGKNIEENQGKVIGGQYRALPEGEGEELTQTEDLDES